MRTLATLLVTLLAMFPMSALAAVGPVPAASYPQVDTAELLRTRRLGAFYGDWFEQTLLTTLRRDLRKVLPVRQQARLDGLDFGVKRAAATDPGSCTDPRIVAYTDFERLRPAVVLCSANMDYLNFLTRQRAGMTNFAAAYRTDHLRDSYLAKVSEVFWDNRARLQRGDPALRLGCSFEYFVFLTEVAHAPQECGLTTTRAEFEPWRRQAGYFIDEGRFAEVRAAYPGRTDWQAGMSFMNAMSEALMGDVLLFSVLHEVGHVVLQHSLDRGGCEAFREEAAADVFAERAMLKLDLATDKAELRKPQAIRAVYVVSLRPSGRAEAGVTPVLAERLRDGARRSIAEFVFVPYRGSTREEALVDKRVLDILRDTRVPGAGASATCAG